MLKRFGNFTPSDIKISLPKIALATVVLLLAVGFVAWFVGQEKYIYFWDYALYHTNYRYLGTLLPQAPFETTGRILNSIRKADYNHLPAVFLLPFYYLFGAGRLAYILSVTVTYAFPAIILFPTLLKRFHKTDFPKANSGELALSLIAIIVIALLPQFWIPVLLGYVDVVGVIIIFSILLLYFRESLSQKRLKDLVWLGLLLSFLILLRRWYAYWVVGFFAAAGAQAAFDYFRGSSEFKNFKLEAKNLLITGLLAVGSFFIIATPIAVKMLKTDYRDAFSAYRQSESLFWHLERLCDHFGLLTVLICLAGLVIAGIKRETRRLAFFLSVHFAVAFYLFTRTQNIDIHHNYWVISLLVIFAGLFLFNVYSYLSSRVGKIAFAVILTVVCAANFSIVFSVRAGEALKPVSFIFSKTRLYPKTRSDLEQIHQILSTLNDLTVNSPSKIYVLSSSLSLNSSVLKNGCYAFEADLQQLEPKIFHTRDVDKRDGFPLDMFRAEYVVVASPVGYHLKPEDQRIVGILADQLLSNTDLGTHYRKLPFEFALEDNRQVYIYRREQKIRAEELIKISESFINIYPNNKETFEIKSETLRELTEN